MVMDFPDNVVTNLYEVVRLLYAYECERHFD